MSSLFDYPEILPDKTDSFAYYTLKKRLPSIVDLVIESNHFTEKTNTQLLSYKKSLENGVIGFVNGRAIEGAWESQYIGQKWSNVPFYKLEAYFYHFLLHACDYFTHFIDPFGNIKKADLQKYDSVLISILEELDDLDKSTAGLNKAIERRIDLTLWGNMADLSQLHYNRQHAKEPNILIDDKKELLKIIKGQNLSIDIILDNGGLELFSDLILAEFLACSGHQVTLHAKSDPMFVSDVIESDIKIILEYLRAHGNTNLNNVAEDISYYIDEGGIQIMSNIFWNLPKYFNEMPTDLSSHFGRSDLLIFKGDANYRRIFGDRVIPHHRSPNDLAAYLGVTSFAIRTLKSEILLGIDEGMVKDIEAKEKNWLTNGQFGIIQQLC